MGEKDVRRESGFEDRNESLSESIGLLKKDIHYLFSHTLPQNGN